MEEAAGKKQQSVYMFHSLYAPCLAPVLRLHVSHHRFLFLCAFVLFFTDDVKQTKYS